MALAEKKKSDQVRRNKTANWSKISLHLCVAEGTRKEGKAPLSFYDIRICKLQVCLIEKVKAPLYGFKWQLSHLFYRNTPFLPL